MVAKSKARTKNMNRTVAPDPGVSSGNTATNLVAVKPILGSTADTSVQNPSLVNVSAAAQSLEATAANANSHVDNEIECPEDGVVNSDTAAPNPESTDAPPKKKKKRKPKKSASAKAAAAAAANLDNASQAKPKTPPVLCISRNKHWKYISSYHGPWLQLPLELLDSLLVLNLDPATLSAPVVPSASVNVTGGIGPTSTSNSNMSMQTNLPGGKQRDRNAYAGLGIETQSAQAQNDSNSSRYPSPYNNDSHSPYSNYNYSNTTPSPPPFPEPLPGKATPPPIDPGVFRCVTAIRRLIDEAAELAVRAASGGEISSGFNNNSYSGLVGGSYNMMGMMGGMGMSFGGGMNMGNGMLGGNNNNGRTPTMSATRIHRLRVQAVQKLAAAYRADEIASSVMVMQGGSVFDDLAERVLRIDPNDLDARYVHFFHEKIPSRQLAESTTTQLLDELIAQEPHRLELYRTRGIVHGFRQEHVQATKDFTYALKEARAGRRMRSGGIHGESHNSNKCSGGDDSGGKSKSSKKGGKAKKKAGGEKSRSKASSPGGEQCEMEDGTTESPEEEPLLHPSVLPDAPGPLEPQLLFLRGAAYLQHAIWLIETSVFGLEGIISSEDDLGTAKTAGSTGGKPSMIDGAELRLCYLENGKYGGTEMNNPDGPLGHRDGPKAKAYRGLFGFGPSPDDAKVDAATSTKLRDTITSLLKRSIRDHEKFLSHFDTLEGPGHVPDSGAGPAGNLAERTEYAFFLSESIRPGNQNIGGIHASSSNYTWAPSTSNSGRTTPTGSSSNDQTSPPEVPQQPAMFTTYHPLLVESHFSILLAQLMLGDFAGLLPAFARTAELVDGLEGYPVFLPPRSMAQAEFIEVLERLAGGWKAGREKHSYFGKGDTSQIVSVSVDKKGKNKVNYEVDSSDSNIPASSSLNGHLCSFSSSASMAPPPSSSSSSAIFFSGKAPPSSSSSPALYTEEEPATTTPPALSPLLETLDCARILLAPVVARQKERVDKAAADRAAERAERARARAAASTALAKKYKEIKENPDGLAPNGRNTPSSVISTPTTPSPPTSTNMLTALATAVAAKKPPPINIPLHGPRVEVVLAWLGAGCLIDLEEAQAMLSTPAAAI